MGCKFKHNGQGELMQKMTFEERLEEKEEVSRADNWRTPIRSNNDAESSRVEQVYHVQKHQQ